MLPKKRAPTHPGVILATGLEELGMTQLQLAKMLSVSVQTVNTLIKGKRGMTASLAVKLGKALKTSPEMWMNLQTNHDIWIETHKRSAA